MRAKTTRVIRDPGVQRVLRPLRGDLLLDMIVLPGILVPDIRDGYRYGKGTALPSHR